MDLNEIELRLKIAECAIQMKDFTAVKQMVFVQMKEAR